jgi:cation diffusion facilitator family transporter
MEKDINAMTTEYIKESKVLHQLKAKHKAAKISLAAVSLLVLIKALAGVFTGSIGIRADAIHSAIDLTGVFIGFIGIRISSRPADKDHTFGHDKSENIAGVIIAGFIFIAVIAISYEAITKLIYGSNIELISVGIYITVVALLINVILSRYISRVARVTDSVALEATARDILADALSSIAVLVGLILVRITGLFILDPIVALMVSLLIARAAFHTMKRSVAGLMDERLPEYEEQLIRSCIMEHNETVVGFHKLRSRKSGSRRFIDVHLVVPRDMNVEDAHRFCNHMEEDIANKLEQSDVTIHVEPCVAECDECVAICSNSSIIGEI